MLKSRISIRTRIIRGTVLLFTFISALIFAKALLRRNGFEDVRFPIIDDLLWPFGLSNWGYEPFSDYALVWKIDEPAEPWEQRANELMARYYRLSGDPRAGSAVAGEAANPARPEPSEKAGPKRRRVDL